MKKALVVMLVVLMVCGMCSAADWSATVLGGGEALQVRVGAVPAERTEIGVYAMWQDSDIGGPYGDTDVVGGGVYGKYNLAEDQEFQILSFKTPVTWSIGGMIGACAADVPKKLEDIDAQLCAITGLMFGDEKAQLGVEYQYAFDEDLWKELGSLDDQHSVLFVIKWRF